MFPTVSHYKRLPEKPLSSMFSLKSYEVWHSEADLLAPLVPSLITATTPSLRPVLPTSRSGTKPRRRRSRPSNSTRPRRHPRASTSSASRSTRARRVFWQAAAATGQCACTTCGVARRLAESPCRCVALSSLPGACRAHSELLYRVPQMRVNQLAFNPLQPPVLLCASEDHNLYTFDMRNLSTTTQIYKGHVGA